MEIEKQCGSLLSRGKQIVDGACESYAWVLLDSRCSTLIYSVKLGHSMSFVSKAQDLS
jgi:hypothetical protein